MYPNQSSELTCHHALISLWTTSPSKTTKDFIYTRYALIACHIIIYLDTTILNNGSQKKRFIPYTRVPIEYEISLSPAKARPIYSIANTTTAYIYIYIVNDLTIIYMLDSPMTCTVCDLSFQKAPEFYKILFARQCEYTRAWWRHDSYTTWLQNVAKANRILYMKNYRTTFLRIYKRHHWTRYSQAIYIYFTLHFKFENKQDMLFPMVRNESVAIFNDEFALYPIKRETTRRIIKWLFLNLETRKIVWWKYHV